MNYCCEDFRITIEDYHHITIEGKTIRFAGHWIRFCPYCGGKL